MEGWERPVAVFDSGLGGISVLNALLRIMPNENYIYFGDSKHAPYGTKTHEVVQQMTLEHVERLVEKGAKSVTVACNTATCAAIDALRRKYPQIPMIGIEPALKPAVMDQKGSTVVVMATAMTLSEPRFKRLMEQYQKESTILPLPCSGLVEHVEVGDFDSEEVKQLLRNLFAPLAGYSIDAVVLGCTHFPFLSNAIRDVLGAHVKLFDGAGGTARETRHKLELNGHLTRHEGKGSITFLNSRMDEALRCSVEHMLVNPGLQIYYGKE